MRFLNVNTKNVIAVEIRRKMAYTFFKDARSCFLNSDISLDQRRPLFIIRLGGGEGQYLTKVDLPSVAANGAVTLSLECVAVKTNRKT